MESNKSSSKLSVLALFDDMCRFSTSNSVTGSDSELIGLLQNFEENRIRMVQYKNENITKDKIIDKIQLENHQLKVRLQSIRLAFTREVHAKESLKKDYKQLCSKLTLIQELLNEEHRNNNNNNVSSSKSVMSVLSDIDSIVTSRPSTSTAQTGSGGGVGSNGSPAQFDNPNLNISNDSLESELLFDKSDDNLDDEQQRTIEYKVKVNEDNQQQQQFNESTPKKGCSTIDEADEEGEVSEKSSELNVCFISNEENVEKTILAIPKQITENNITIDSNLDCTQRNKLVRRLSSNITQMNLLRSNSRLEPERLSTREHSFQQKKAFRPTLCTPCGKNIGFCSKFLVCTECRGVAHLRCRNNLPKPCLPYVTGAGLRKMTSSANQNHILMIGDFAPLNTRPCVPALLIHCCNEIDRRINMALKDPKVKDFDSSPVVGLYRISGLDRAVRELRTKVLESKMGIPDLSTISDVHVLCGTVKLFLRDLDDPLVTRILWHDFCRASDHIEKNASNIIDENGTDSDYGSHEEDLDLSINDEFYESIQVLKEVILQLPDANRDSMAFLFLHFRHLTDSQAITKMNARSLAKIFAPTMIGSAVPRTSMTCLSNDNIKQISIMGALFRISRNFWHGLLNDPNFCPFKEMGLNDEQMQQQTKRKSLPFTKNRSTTSLANLINQGNNNNKDEENNKLAGNLKPLANNQNLNQFRTNRTSNLNEIY